MNRRFNPGLDSFNRNNKYFQKELSIFDEKKKSFSTFHKAFLEQSIWICNEWVDDVIASLCHMAVFIIFPKLETRFNTHYQNA